MSKHWFNNGLINVFREEKPNDTFVPGMLESSKKKMSEYKKSEEQINKMKATKIERNRKLKEETGSCISEETRQKMSGRTPWNKGKSSWCKGLTAENDERIKERNKKISESSFGKPGTNKGKKFSEEHKKKIGNSNKGKPKRKLFGEDLERKIKKSHETKLKNNSYSYSKVEEKLYEKLLKDNPNKTIIRQYMDIRYPYKCDFYIVEDDLFIELNAHWTHGGMPFDKNDSKCINKLNEWKEKAKNDRYYKSAIETWTVRDVEKINTAKVNKLNYVTIYSNKVD